MSRFIVERAFRGGLSLHADDHGANACARIVGGNAESGVTWIHSYVSVDKKKTFCIYDAPSPEAIRRVAHRNNLPVDRIVEVTVLDPYFYH
jgi:hypothetical protein